MSPFPDTSFLCSVYREQVHSPCADAFMETLPGPLTLSTLLVLEFRQSIRLQARLHARDATKGYPKTEGSLMLRDLQADLAGKIVAIVPVDWADVHQLAERLSATYTEQRGHRLADLLHLGAEEFLTFDANQKLLAEEEGLRVKV